MTSTKYSIAAAHRITGKSRTTISKHIKQGKLSCETNSDGKQKLIDASELIRVYGDECNFDQEEGASTPAKAKQSSVSSPTVQGVQVGVNSVHNQLDKEIAERQREREHYLQQIEHLQDALKLAMEGHDRATKLLEDRSGGRDWEKSLQALEERIANQETLARQERQRADRLKQALRDEQNKTFWQKLFG